MRKALAYKLLSRHFRRKFELSGDEIIYSDLKKINTFASQ